MSALVEMEVVYSAVCMDCQQGSDGDGSEDAAAEWADRHNEENHE